MMQIEVRPCDGCGEHSGTATGVSPHTSTFSFQYSLQSSALNFVLKMPLSEGQAGEAWELSRTTKFCRISASTGRNSTGLCVSVFIEWAFPLGADDILSVFGTIILWFCSSAVLYSYVISNTPFHSPHSVHYAPETIVSLHQGFISYLQPTGVKLSQQLPHGQSENYTLQPSGHYMHSTLVTICTAQWSLYAQHTGHYMYRRVVTICTTSLSSHKFYVQPTHCIYVFYVDLRTNSHYLPIQH
jgi:hypothetical protein